MFEGFTLNLIKLKNTYADELNIQIHETLSMPKKSTDAHVPEN